MGWRQHDRESPESLELLVLCLIVRFKEELRAIVTILSKAPLTSELKTSLCSMLALKSPFEYQKRHTSPRDLRICRGGVMSFLSAELLSQSSLVMKDKAGKVVP